MTITDLLRQWEQQGMAKTKPMPFNPANSGSPAPMPWTDMVGPQQPFPPSNHPIVGPANHAPKPVDKASMGKFGGEGQKADPAKVAMMGYQMMNRGNDAQAQQIAQMNQMNQNALEQIRAMARMRRNK